MDVDEVVKTAIREAVAEHLKVNPVGEVHRLMTLEAAARYCDCTIKHIQNLIAAGVLRAFHWPWPDERKRDKPYVDKRDLDRIIDEGKANGK